MTVQIVDEIYFNRSSYSIVGLKGASSEWSDNRLFNPKNVGMQPKAINTKNYSGFHCKYEFFNKKLFLTSMILKEINEYYVPVGKAQPEIQHRLASYEDIDLFIPFSGKISLLEGRLIELKDYFSEKIISIKLKEGMVIG